MELVAAHFVWDEYPGLRAGRLYAGQGDLGRSPRGETHAIDDADAAVTVCGLPRQRFPERFPATARLRAADPCAACSVQES